MQCNKCRPISRTNIAVILCPLHSLAEELVEALDSANRTLKQAGYEYLPEALDNILARVRAAKEKRT